MKYGVMSKSGIVTVAPRGKEQAQQWADYTGHTLLGSVEETFAEFDGTEWKRGN